MSRRKARARSAAEGEKTPHRKKKKKHTLLKLLIVLLLLTGIFLLWHYRERIVPDDWLIRLDNLLSGSETGEGFPIEINGGDIVTMEATTDGYLSVLSDTGLTFYNGKGGEEARRTHGFSSPGMRVAGKYVLLIENGGSRLRLETRAKTVWEKTTDFPILTAAVSEGGSVAVLTASDQSYTCEVIVYDKGGTEIYHRRRTEQGVNLALSPDGRRVAVTGIGVREGTLYASLEVYALSKENAECTYRQDDLLMHHLRFLDNDTVAAAGTSAVWITDLSSGKTTVTPISDGELIAASFNSHGVAVVRKPYGSTHGGEITVIGNDGAVRYVQSFDGTFRGIGSYVRGYLVLIEGDVLFCGNDRVIGHQAVADDGLKVAAYRNRILVLGLTELSSYALPQ